MVASEFFLGAMRPTLGALVADLSAPPTRRAAFSLSYLGINLGVSIGPLLAGWLFQHSLNWLFWVDALTTAAALGILVRFVPRRTQPGAVPPRPSPGSVRLSSLKVFLRHTILVPLSLLLMVYNFVYSQMIFTLALQLVALFGVQGPPTYGLVWAANGLIVLALTPVALRFTKAWTNLGSMALGMAFFTAGVAVFLFHPDLVWVLASAFLWTTGEVLLSIHYGDLVTSQSPEEFRGRFQGYVGFLGSLGFVAAPLASGLVAQTLGLTGVWWLATMLVAAVGVGFWTLNRRI
jgi:MFS family permease